VTNDLVPTLEDVARAAKVSTATVSRCMNAPEKVNVETRSRVLSVVQQLGYSPNFGARALAVKRTNTIGAIIPTMDNAIFARGIQAFQETLREHGMTLLIASSSYREDLEAEQIRTLTARGADGFLLIGYQRSDDINQFLDNRGIPVLSAWVYDAGNPRLSIGFDNKKAMKDLAREVLNAGHTRIGVISAEQTSNDRARDRYLGIQEALLEVGLSPETLQLIETPYGIESGAVAFRKLMCLPERPTVVMCGNDVLAVGALREAKKIGINVPGDVSITGFDDIELASIADPALTTVHVPHTEMGRQAANMLVGMLNGDIQGQSIELSTSLCLRETLDKVPKD